MTTRPAAIDLPAFLASVRACGVLTRAEADRAVADLPANVESADAAARWLVGRGTLTQFQADRLLAGKPGGLLIGQFALLEPIGSTPTGRVFKARHRTMHRFAAIKVLSADLARTPADREAFKAEARAAARLTHPHVVTVWDVNAIGDRPYLIREYVDGTTAAERVKSFGPMAVPAACEIARQAALGLAHAHEQRVPVSHGAVGPANLLVGRDGTRPAVKVANFGIGRLGGVAPTDYTAPEQTATGTASPAADVYGLGGVLFFLLTGDRPFPAKSAEEAAARHRTEPAPEVELYNPDDPSGVAAVLRAMLAKHPAARPTAAAVAAALAPFADHGGTAAVTVLQPPSSHSWAVAVPVPPPPAMPEPCPFADLTSEIDKPTAEVAAVPTPVMTDRRPQPAAKPAGRAMGIGLVVGFMTGAVVVGAVLAGALGK